MIANGLTGEASVAEIASDGALFEKFAQFTIKYGVSNGHLMGVEIAFKAGLAGWIHGRTNDERLEFGKRIRFPTGTADRLH